MITRSSYFLMLPFFIIQKGTLSSWVSLNLKEILDRQSEKYLIELPIFLSLLIIDNSLLLDFFFVKVWKLLSQIKLVTISFKRDKNYRFFIGRIISSKNS